MRTLTNRLVKTGGALAAAAVLLLGSSTTARAQSGQIGANFIVGVPMGEFKDTLDKVGFGIGVEAGYHLGVAPVEVGLQASIMTYGTESRREPWSNTIPDVTVDVETTNNIALGHIYARLIPATGIVRPYAEGKIGFSYLYTATSVESEGAGENGSIATSTNFDDATFSYGGAGGALIELYKGAGTSSDDIGEVLLDVRVGYLAGGEAEYLTTGSIRRDDGRVTYTPKKSRTDLIDARLGVQVRF